MAAAEKDLAAFLQQHKVPAAIANELATSLTFGAFAMLAASPDELSTTLQASLSSEAVTMLNPFVLANMKAAWSAALATFASGSSGQPSSAAALDASKSASDVASWSDTFPPKLSIAFTKQIITRFESAYPGDILDDSNTPSSRLLALCNKYLSDKSFKYIPWHLRLSDKTQEEISLHRPRKVPRLEDLIWDDVPSRDIPSNGISQMFLFHLLELVSIAYAMLEAAHLSSFRKYNKLFISIRVLARICLKHISRMIHVYIVACGLKGCGCATNCAIFGPPFICVRSLAQVRAPSTFRFGPCCCMALRTSAPLPWQILVRFRLESFAAAEGRLTFILAADLASVCGSPCSGATLLSFLCLSDWKNFYFIGKEFNRVAHFFFHIDGKERRRLERRIRTV